MLNKAIQHNIDLLWRSWIVLGPVALAMTFLIAFTSVHTTFLVIPMIALVGVFLTHMWAWRGFLVATGALAVACVVMMIMLPQALWVWNVVLACACVCSLVVTRLGFDECEALTSGRLQEGARDREGLRDAKVALTRAEETHRASVEALEASIATLQTEIVQRNEALAAKEHLLGLARDDVSVIDAERQRLMKVVVTSQGEMHGLQQQVVGLQETERLLRDENLRLVEEVESGAETRRVQGLYKQLKEQFDEKSRILDETRRELFVSQEKVSTAQHELEFQRLSANREHEAFCNEIVAEAAREIDSIESELREEIAHLQSFVNALLSENKT